MVSGRCGYESAAGALEDIGAVCCWRPVWEDRDRCVWHAEDEGKPLVVLEEARDTIGDRLDEAVLRGTVLDGLDWFAGCTAHEADFTGARMRSADFTGADVRRATFSRADLRGATFDGANLEDTAFDYADLGDASFEEAQLYRTRFSDARVNHETNFGERVVYERWMAEADTREEQVTQEDVTIWTYRALQRLYRENALPRMARAYFLKEKSVQRRVAWLQRDFSRVLRLEGSRLTMRYGTSPWRVIATSLAVILISALFYPLTGGIQETNGGRPVTYTVEDPTSAPQWYLLLVFFKSVYFSTITFATLGYGDIQPVGAAARAIAGIESLVGALLMALLVFVLTRSVE